MIVVNTTFTGCAVQGDAWGPAVDVRGSTYFINCTFAGNLFLDNNHGGSGGFAERRYGGNVYFLNTVGAYNYNRAASDASGELESGKDFYADGATTFINTIRNGKLSDGTTDLVPASLFADTHERATLHAWGGEVALKSGMVVPTPSELGDYSSRVFEIAPNGPLDGTGFPVKANADYTHVCFSADDGETWTDLYKDASADDSTLALITSDQRGVAYYKGKTPIGAATYADSSVKTGFLIIIR